jgi:hypothetical protein
MAEYTAVELADRFEEMVDVLNRMPSVVRKQKMIHWPDYPNDPNQAYGYNDYTISRPKPSGEQIDRCDQALLWLLYLDKPQKELIWARASKFSWRKIAMYLGCNKDTAKLKWTVILMELIEKLKNE